MIVTLIDLANILMGNDLILVKCNGLYSLSDKLYPSGSSSVTQITDSFSANAFPWRELNKQCQNTFFLISLNLMTNGFTFDFVQSPEK